MSIKIIAAVSLNGVIGKVEKIPDPIDIDVKYEMRKAHLKLVLGKEFNENDFPELLKGPEPQFIDQCTLPWPMDKYPEDMKWFRSQTANSTVIMGRRTWESIASKPLPKRRNIVITKFKIDGIETYTSLNESIEYCKGDKNIWLIGGGNIYREGMKYATEIYLTLIPEIVNGNDLVYFPWIDPSKFKIEEFISIENSELKVARYVRNIYNYL